MRARVVAAGFGDYAAGLRRTQPRFPPAMRYALMERWNDCTHTFVFGFGDSRGLRCHYRLTLHWLGSPARRSVPDCCYWSPAFSFPPRCHDADPIYRAGDVRPAAPAYTREERDQAARSFLFYIISAQLLCTSQNKGDPTVLACLRDLDKVGSFDWATLSLAHLYHGLDVWTRGSGESNWLFIRPLEVWSYEYCIYPGSPSGDSSIESWRIPRYLAHYHHTYASGEDPEYWRSFLNDRELSDLSLEPWDCEAWRTYPGREVAELHTRSRLLLRGYWADRYFDTPIAPARRRVPHALPRHMCLLEGLTREDLEIEYRVLEYIQEQKTLKTATHYRAEAVAEVGGGAAPSGSVGVVLGDVPFPPGMEVVLDPGLGLGSGIIIPADLRQAPPPVQLDPEHTTHVSAQRYQEICQRFSFARSYIGRLYSERHELELENGRLRRHQSRQSSALSRLQTEVEWLRTRLEVKGIPLDSSDEDEGGSSSDDGPPECRWS
ncbi:hypothetical protein JCGZ_03141 [Jatropha curcas]|uniref:Aminotransferase-like plant mobile domain-containing protein n=1 Tax=Jatropha curcas TaxID=180498 RepID=A0A067L535_JATCU|nr:hypothetical protein JCGZ_03141 [Jatropha curcas]